MNRESYKDKDVEELMKYIDYVNYGFNELTAKLIAREILKQGYRNPKIHPIERCDCAESLRSSRMIIEARLCSGCYGSIGNVAIYNAINDD